jgi:hypothetical protein
VFSAPARQSGSVIDPGQPFPDAARLLAVRVGETARKMGFQGIAGLDIGWAEDGRLLVLDPNFRVCASTSQLLLHGAAARRSGLPVSLWFQAHPGGRFRDLARRLHAPIGDGWFVPTRLFNAAQHPAADGRHTITGFVLGRDRAAAELAAERLQGMLAGSE